MEEKVYICECGHPREDHKILGDEYGSDFYDCKIEDCPCTVYFCAEDKFYC